VWEGKIPHATRMPNPPQARTSTVQSTMPARIPWRITDNAQHDALLQDGGFLHQTSCLKTVDRAHALYMVSAEWPQIIS
jgi:hypothetical protein